MFRWSQGTPRAHRLESQGTLVCCLLGLNCLIYCPRVGVKCSVNRNGSLRYAFDVECVWVPCAHACCWMVSVRTRTQERFPSGSGAKNLLAGARDKDPVPEPSPMDPVGSGKIPLASEQTCPWPQLRSLCSRAWQPQLLSPCVATTKAWEP